MTVVAGSGVVLEIEESAAYSHRDLLFHTIFWNTLH